MVLTLNLRPDYVIYFHLSEFQPQQYEQTEQFRTGMAGFGQRAGVATEPDSVEQPYTA